MQGVANVGAMVTYRINSWDKSKYRNFHFVLKQAFVFLSF
ncbi:hypothetical protein [Campylobacter jejuni]